MFVVSAALTGAWNLWFSSTQVGFVNYQVINLGQISKANHNSFIKISEISTDELDDLDTYDMVFINAMGLRITEEQRAQIQKAADGGLPVLTTAATNPANKIISLDSIQADTLKHYLSNGGRRNYRSMLNYVRVHIDKKLFSVSEPEAVMKRADDVLYHMDPKKPEDEELGFNTVAGYNTFLQHNGLWKENAPRIIVTGPMGEPSGLIAKLEETGNMVYPIRSMRSFIQNHGIDSVRPSAIINMAHGRMGEPIVDYLAKQNIPLFSPLNVNRLVEEWERDKMGMNGGFMSQSIVTPEIDGAIRPFALFGHYKDEEGLQHAYAIPERLETFVETVNNYIALQRKPNSEKRVAIYYYKGPGQNALTAGGMEVVPSLYNLLQRMKREGYKVDGLPTSSKELEQMIQSQGAVFGSYAEGAFDRFMETGKPELITKEQYESGELSAATVLAELGGFDLAGMTGLFLGGAAAKIPVLTDGFLSTVSGLLAVLIRKEAKDYMLASHISTEPAGAAVLQMLDLPAPLHMGMHLGEGSGAVAMIPLLRMGAKVYEEMSTFSDISVEQYVDYQEKGERP